MKKFITSLNIALAIMFGIAAPLSTPKVEAAVANDYPVRIVAPSIKLDSPIQGMGVNELGEMDVPSGKTNNVGWYKYGVVPGKTGTAVLDAHVFAAFKNLSKLKTGNSIYIYMKSGKKLQFVVTKAKTYSLSSLSPYTLFAATNTKQINLITCAGTFSKAADTYSHRLIVSAKLV